jgi:hypothetical protein
MPPEEDVVAPLREKIFFLGVSAGGLVGLKLQI